MMESDAFLPFNVLNIHLIKEVSMLGTVLWVVLILALIGALPTWPYSASWGYYPSGGLGLVLLILIVLAISGR